MAELYVKKFSDLTLDELYEILKARVDVFVVEQHCPYPELDNIDQDAYHVFLKNEGKIVAYLRVFNRNQEERNIQIGRVLTLERNKNYGSQIMVVGVHVAKEMMQGTSIYIEAQCYAIGFYKKFGFKVVSEPFLEDDIPHVKMILDLNEIVGFVK